VVGNKTAEITLSDGEKVQCEVVIPVNIDPGATYRHLNEKIAKLKAMLPPPLP
jgi:hypothetical protein